MQPKSARHITVYYDEGYFSAWPFNGGFWQFSDGELAVGFVRGRVDYDDPDTIGHFTVDVEHGEQVILRSTDGGETWPLETMTSVYHRPAFDERTRRAKTAYTHDGPGYDPAADGYCLLSGYGIATPEAKHVAWVMISTDRGHTWSEPRRLPGRGFAHMGGRPSYLVREDGRLLLFVHASRQSADEAGAFPVVYGSWDGGASWGLIGEMPRCPSVPMSIMPYPLQLPNGRILAAVRRQYNNPDAFSQVYYSDDQGRTWGFLSRVNDWGAPANLNLLPDGRLVCTYGYRQQPWGIRARVSTDQGLTWGGEIILRDDGGSYDVGYPRTHLRSDGKLVTVYYFNRADDPVQCTGGVRHIAATIWEI